MNIILIIGWILTGAVVVGAVLIRRRRVRAQLEARDPARMAELALRLEPIIAARAKARESSHTKQGYQKSDNPIHTKRELASIAGVSHDTIHKGKVYVDARSFVQDEGKNPGVVIATKKGLCLSPDLMLELIPLLSRAQERAVELSGGKG